MKKKIVITGGLGYIGTELCKLYSGVSWNHNITVIDNRFISERVNQIRNWNMEFIQGDILDADLIQKHCHDADVVHHLAGITDVPKTKSESNNSRDENDLSYSLSLIKKYEVIKECYQKAQHYINLASNSLSVFNDCEEKNILENLTSFSLSRNF